MAAAATSLLAWGCGGSKPGTALQSIPEASRAADSGPAVPAAADSAAGDPARPAPSSPGLGNSQGSPVGDTVPLQFIYVIHGDAGYSYYGRDGKRRQADAEAVAQAKNVAREAGDAQVFLFHQRPHRFLGMVPADDGLMRLYRNGKLAGSEKYRRAGTRDAMQAEGDLYRKYASPARHRIFLYFGHEIPADSAPPSRPYSRSKPRLAFNLASFTEAVRGFGPGLRPDAKPFDLLVLSTCHGGTAAVTSALAPYADFLLASPGDLHLTYLDSRAAVRLVRERPLSSDANAESWGKALASDSFAQLCENTATSVTVALYETDKAAAYLQAHRDAWAGAGMTGSAGASGAAYRDCAAIPGFGPGGLEAGVTLLYRAPLFGADKGKAFQSGWECAL
jgi:hypothetical protein